MTSYAAQKGRAAQSAQPTAPAAPKSITQAESDRIADNKEFVLKNMPELLPTIRDLHAEGLIDGWRSVKRCELLDASCNA